MFLFWGMVSWSRLLISTLVTVGEPIPGHHDVYLVGTPEEACRGEFGQTNCKTTFLPLLSPQQGVFFWLAKGLYFLLEAGGPDVAQTSGASGRL